jgi:hypothetical protein
MLRFKPAGLAAVAGGGKGLCRPAAWHTLNEIPPQNQ